jgi:serine/threonine-protein kinase
MTPQPRRDKTPQPPQASKSEGTSSNDGKAIPLDQGAHEQEPAGSLSNQPKPASHQPKAASDQPRPVSDQPQGASDKPKPASEQPKGVSDKPKPAPDPPKAASDKPKLDQTKPADVPHPGSPAPPSTFTPSPFTLIGNGPPDLPREAPGVPGVLAPGSQFGIYAVGACIGKGGMARIYRAEHSGLRRQVALKVLIDGFAKDPDGRERFVREARIAAAIKHPNVVNIFDVGVHDDVPYLVMELLEGSDLETLLESARPLEESMIIDIMVPVVAGLIAVHDAGIVHRDLKPGNIFLSRGRYNDLEPKLLDFGISKASGPDQLRLTAHRTFMGTPFYVPPEGLSGGEMTPLSDQYSLGVVMYECATGVTPFSAPTFLELSSLITAGEYVAPSEHNPELSARLARIIERAMSLKPEQRYKDLREMGRELLGLAGQRTRVTWGLSFGEMKPAPTSNAGPHASGRSAPPPMERRWRKPGALVLIGVMQLLVLSAGLAAWISGRVPFQGAARQPSGAPAIAAGRPEAGNEPAVVSSGAAASDTMGRSPPATAAAGFVRPTADREAAAAAGPEAKNRVGSQAWTTPHAADVPSNRDARPARTGFEQVSGGRSPRPPATRRPANSPLEPEPEWALPAVGPSPTAKPGELWLGPNGAPIFD